MKESHKKPILETTPESLTDQSQVNFSEEEFNGLVFNKGQDILIEKSIKCPCEDKVTGQTLTKCLNCGGRRWIFVSKRKTAGVIQALNRKTKFQNWTEDDKGTASLTVRAIDRLAFMDRITLLSVTSIYSENLKFKKYRDKLYAYTIYYPLLITEAYLFQGEDKMLKPLKLNIDYTIDENKLILNNNYSNLNLEVLSISVRYTHYPQYNVIDIPREIIVNKQKNCAEDDVQADLPLNVVIRKAHYVLDAPNLYGDSLFDNTVYDPNSALSLLETLDPQSLLFFIIRSTPLQIQQALLLESNQDKINELRALLDYIS